MDTLAFEEGLRHAGWLLAHQATRAARGELPSPLILMDAGDPDGPHLIRPKVESGTAHEQIAAGELTLPEVSRHAEIWVFSYDMDLDLTGRAMLVPARQPSISSRSAPPSPSLAGAVCVPPPKGWSAKPSTCPHGRPAASSFSPV